MAGFLDDNRNSDKFLAMHDMAAERLPPADDSVLDAVLGGATSGPRTVDTPVTNAGGAKLGLWQIEPGEVDDIEVDEVFLVVAGPS